MKNSVRTLIALMVIISATAVFAQSTFEVKQGEVISVYGNTMVVKMSTGEVKEVAVPADFKFDVNGKMLTVGELTPGMMLTAVVKTTQVPETVRTVQMKNAEVVKVSGSNLIVKQDGALKSYNVPAGFTFVVDGQNKSITDLRPGTKLTAEIVYKSENMVTEKDVNISGVAPVVAPAPVAEPAPAPAPEPEPEPVMPKTASNLPLIGLLGLALLGAGIAIKH